MPNIKPHPRISEMGLTYCPRITPYRAYKIAQFKDRETIGTVMRESDLPPNGYGCLARAPEIIDAAEETWRRVREIGIDALASLDRAVDHLGQMPGSRVLLVASSGFFGETLEQRQQALIDHAIHSGVVINALDSKGLYSEAPPGCRAGDPNPAKCMTDLTSLRTETMALGDRLMLVNSAMADMAQGTGGEFFHNSNDLHAGLRELGSPPDVSYHMSFRPEGVTPDGSFHKLQVKLVHAGDYAVAARPGYFAPAGKLIDDPRSKLERRGASAGHGGRISRGLVVEIRRPSSTQRMLSVVVRIDVSKLPFASAGDRKRELVASPARFRFPGKMVPAKEGAMDLALKQETSTGW